MAQRTQEQKHDNLHRDGQRHPLPLWVRWFIVLFVPLVVTVGAILWIIQGAGAIIPIAVLTALGILIAFSQVLLWLFPSIKHEHSTIASPLPSSEGQHMFSPSSLSLSSSSSVQTHPSDIIRTDQNLTLIAIQQPEQATIEINLGKPIVDWGEAPQVGQFYGRGQELGELKQWIVSDRCRMVTIFGMGGVGKTSLAAKLTEEIKDEFEYVFWRELKNAPSLESILKSCIQFLSNQQRIDFPESVDEQIALLTQYLRDHRCLVVLDNVETILQTGNRTDQYREGYEGYGRLIQRLGETRHQSCLLLTGREKPQEIALLEGEQSPIRSHRLAGLSLADGREILKNKGLGGTEKTWEALIDHYTGNPLALKLVSQFIREVFAGDIAEFLKEGEMIFSDIRDVLDRQFERLSELEQEIMYWLAIERELVSLNDLQENIIRPISKRELHEAMRTLRWRDLVEITTTGATLQNVVMEYITDRLTVRVCKEITSRKLFLFESHALIKAQAKDHVRNSQVRLILNVLTQRLLTTLGKEGIEKKLRKITLRQRTTQAHIPNYVAGNVLNILVHLRSDLHGWDFSHLMVWQAYLQNATLADVNFAHATLAKSVFTDTFGSVLSVSFSPHGELAAGTTSGEIRLWQVPSGTPLQTFQRHTDWVRSVAFNPNGNLLASGGDDQTIRIWDVSSGQCLKILQGHTNRIRSIIFSSDGSTIASGGEDRTIRIWDVSSGQCIKVFQGHTNRVWSVAFSPDGKLLASGSDDQTIRVWEVDTGRCLRVFQGHTNRVWSIAFSPVGNTIVSSDDQAIRIWEVETGHCQITLHGHINRIRSVVFDPQGNIIASSSDDQTIRLWEVSTGQCLKMMQGYSNWIWTITFSPDSSIIVSGGDDQTIRFWKISTGQCLKTLQGHTGQIRSVAFSSDGKLLASCSDDQTIRFWQTSTGQNFKILRGHTNRVWCIAFSPDGKLLASGSDDQTIRLWEIDTGQCLKVFQGHTHWIWSVAFSPHGKLLASSSEDQTIRLWEIDTGQCLKTLRGHTNRIWSIAINPGGNLLASGSDDQTIRLWEIDTGQCLKTLQGHTGQIRSVAFSPDGKLLASGSDDQTIRLWEIDTGRCLKELQGYNSWIWSVTFSSDGRLVASGGHDGTTRLWNVQTGEYLRTLVNEKPYERMNITDVKGLTIAQKATLRTLGAIEDGSEG